MRRRFHAFLVHPHASFVFFIFHVPCETFRVRRKENPDGSPWPRARLPVQGNTIRVLLRDNTRPPRRDEETRECSSISTVSRTSTLEKCRPAVFLYLDHFSLLLRRREQFLEHLSRRCFCTPFVSPVRVVIFVAPSRFISLFVPSSHDVFERPFLLRARRESLRCARDERLLPFRLVVSSPSISFSNDGRRRGRRPRRSCSSSSLPSSDKKRRNGSASNGDGGCRRRRRRRAKKGKSCEKERIFSVN